MRSSGGRVELSHGAGWLDTEHIRHTASRSHPPSSDSRCSPSSRHHHRTVVHTRGERRFDPTRASTTRSSDSPAPPKSNMQQPHPPLILGGHERQAHSGASPRSTPTSSTSLRVRSTASRAAHPVCVKRARSVAGDPESMRFSAALVLCSGRTEAESRPGAPHIGRDVSELRETGAAGTPDEVAETLMAFRWREQRHASTCRPSTSTTLDHIELVAAEVAPHLWRTGQSLRTGEPTAPGAASSPVRRRRGRGETPEGPGAGGRVEGVAQPVVEAVLRPLATARRLGRHAVAAPVRRARHVAAQQAALELGAARIELEPGDSMTEPGRTPMRRAGPCAAETRSSRRIRSSMRSAGPTTRTTGAGRASGTSARLAPHRRNRLGTRVVGEDEAVRVEAAAARRRRPALVVHGGEHHRIGFADGSLRRATANRGELHERIRSTSPASSAICLPLLEGLWCCPR